MSPRRRVSLRERARHDRRGVAILLVVATLMFLTVLVTDITYGSRVRYLTAVHEREEAQAYWLAVTGVNTYRLILKASKDLEKSGFADQLSSLGLSGDSLWQTIPAISSGLLRMFAGSGEPSEDDLESFAASGEVDEETREESRESGGTRFGGRNFLDFDGDFNAEVRGEDCRINLAALGKIQSGANVQESAVGLQLYGLLSGEDNEQFLRDRNLERWDLVYNVLDWVDADNTVASGKGGYEDDFYNTLDSPYLSKNAPFDTPSELRLVQGWQDAVYDRFAEQLTIFGSGKINIACADDTTLSALLRAYATRSYSDDELSRILSDMHGYTSLAAFKDANDFITWLKNSAGYEPRSDMASAITTTTKVFTITSTGVVGDATATITVVLDYSTSTQGSITYWRVD